jgi:hypothetical protein
MSATSLPERSSLAAITLAGALGALLMSTAGVLIALQLQWQRFAGFSLWRMLKILLTITTPLQGLEFCCWAVITGILIALGSWAAPANRSRAFAALAAGALVPVGLVLLAHQLGKIWPDTNGPTDAPLMTLILACSALVLPWLLGRLVRRIPSRRPAFSSTSATS